MRQFEAGAFPIQDVAELNRLAEPVLLEWDQCAELDSAGFLEISIEDV